jgi:hypothetical protein
VAQARPLSERHSRKLADLAMSRTWQTRVLPPHERLRNFAAGGLTSICLASRWSREMRSGQGSLRGTQREPDPVTQTPG